MYRKKWGEMYRKKEEMRSNEVGLKVIEWVKEWEKCKEKERRWEKEQDIQPVYNITKSKG